MVLYRGIGVYSVIIIIYNTIMFRYIIIIIYEVPTRNKIKAADYGGCRGAILFVVGFYV